MRGFNKAILAGNLTRDPDVRYTSGKKAFARFTLAVGKVWKDRDGVKQEHTDFIPCVVWGSLAEIVEQWLEKGSAVLVEGAISTRTYEKDGEKKYITEINVQNLNFLGGSSSQKSSSGHGDSSGFGQGDGKTLDVSGYANEAEEEGEQVDIPF